MKIIYRVFALWSSFSFVLRQSSVSATFCGRFLLPNFWFFDDQGVVKRLGNWIWCATVRSVLTSSVLSGNGPHGADDPQKVQLHTNAAETVNLWSSDDPSFEVGRNEWQSLVNCWWFGFDTVPTMNAFVWNGICGGSVSFQGDGIRFSQSTRWFLYRFRLYYLVLPYLTSVCTTNTPLRGVNEAFLQFIFDVILSKACVNFVDHTFEAKSKHKRTETLVLHPCID